MKRKLHTPLDETAIKELELRDIVYLSGELYTMRDRAHQRILDYRRAGKAIPIPIERGAVIYHCGPLVRNHEVIAAGPTTSARMETATPELIEALQIRAIIGKGGMGTGTRDAMCAHGCVYLAMTGGAAVLAATRIKNIISVYWTDLGMAEAVWHMHVDEFGPLVVGIDARGDSLYDEL
ncbi:MAG: FumA C-terminus/TtdB family hydratase beta subunit [Methanophagales archaeon]|nr:FumA C-terminus/TtdB family hydratase beta subunit [Methanophagales archaeon]